MTRAKKPNARSSAPIKRAPRGARILGTGGATIIICFVVLTIIVVAAWRLKMHAYQHRNSTAHPATQPTATRTLLVSASSEILPIRIAPKDTAYILQLNPDIDSWTWKVPNKGSSAISWPTDIHPGKGPPADRFYAYELTNGGDKALFDVAVPFEVSFHELEMVQVGVTNNKNGPPSVMLPPPTADHVVVTLGNPIHANDVTAARDGTMVKKFTRFISLPSIAAGSTGRIYLVNQSKFIAKFTFPEQANAVTAENGERVPVALIRADDTTQDVGPWFGLAPSTSLRTSQTRSIGRE